jgi:hypothetical protein
MIVFLLKLFLSSYPCRCMNTAHNLLLVSIVPTGSALTCRYTREIAHIHAQFARSALARAHLTRSLIRRLEHRRLERLEHRRGSPRWHYGPFSATYPDNPLEDIVPDRSLRGMSIGSKSMESDEGVDFAPRFQAYYDCPNGHTIILPFATDADVPPIWECRCGEEALLRDAEKPEPKATKPQRTHWDMLLERRTVKELEDLLDERLELLRAGKLRRSA